MKQDFSKRKKVTGYTIDAHNSMDLDDSFNILIKENCFILQVSIADVSHFIQRNSLLFQRALKKIETHYYKNSVSHMLPVIYSEKKISLLPDREVPTITFEFDVDFDYNILDFKFYESVFVSLKKMSYSEFDKLVLLKEVNQDIAKFRLAVDFSTFLLNNRRKAGALAIYDLKKMIYSDEEGIIRNLSIANAHTGNIVVQEFMILTNSMIGQLMAKKDLPFLFRNHTVKNISPDRDEILNQYNHALLDPVYLDQLAGKIGFWFDAAVYENIIKGHYGLNLSVYTHITSPIRRVADLINQFQLKNYLNSSYGGFNFQELAEISQYLKSKYNEMKEKSNDFFRNKARAEAKTSIVKENKYYFESLPEKKFAQVIKTMCEEETLHHSFIEVLINKLEDGRLGIESLYKILFTNKVNKPDWDPLITKVIDFVNSTQGFSSQLLNIESQKNSALSTIYEEYIENNNNFYCRVIGVINDLEYSSLNYAFGKSKKEASQIGHNLFLSNYLNGELVLKNKSIIPDDRFEIELDNTESEIEENFIGKLNEIHQKNINLSSPVYKFTIEGNSNNPIITCNCIMKFKNNEYNTKAISSNKKISKHISAKKMFEILQAVLTYSL
jgi:ribonuclease R